MVIAKGSLSQRVVIHKVDGIFDGLPRHSLSLSVFCVYMATTDNRMEKAPRVFFRIPLFSPLKEQQGCR